MSDIRNALYGLFTDSLTADLPVPLEQQYVFFQDNLKYPNDVPTDKLFAIIRMDGWSAGDDMGRMRRRLFSVWVHRHRRDGADHGVLQAVLDRIVPALLSATGIVGSDGTITSITFGGMSADLTDEYYQTIVNNASFSAGVR